MKRREQLYRNTAKVRRYGLYGGLFGVLGWGAAQAVKANPDHLYYHKVLLIECFSVLMVLVSSIVLVDLVWPFLVEVDDEGLTLRLRGFTTRLPWESVELLAVVKVGDAWDAPNIDVRLVPGVRLRGRLASKRDGRRTYTLISLDNLTARPEEVIALLRRYGRGRVDAQEYLEARAARRAVGRYLRGEEIQADPYLAEYLAEQRRIEAEAAAGAG
ncbi:hypothetical protein [Micromonospora sp. NPDC047074]|uniref:hypothetical protein n=1 Tax=Micromonospora sp. NPDC047074 TaxID=3154339 RepID=UPI0033E42BB0